MPISNRRVAGWIRGAGRFERIFAGVLGAIFLVGVVLIANGLVMRADEIRSGAASSGGDFTETVQSNPASR
jgi:hypothetical protein